ncbi:3-isopropylmalate dehydratase small subunit [Synergistales bacterium]|nr:3-isopropylmalate dehydratase small subunit [Synergistales bacterium]
MSRCWKLGDNVSTDEILPFQYMVLTDPSDLGKHVLGNVKPGFAAQLARGDILVAGLNLGYGSSREHAPLALKGAGIGAVVASSFARIFFRNCINIGLPAIVCPAASNDVLDGDDIEINLRSGEIRNATQDTRYAFDPFPPFIMEYIENGGLIDTLNKRNFKST